MIRRGFVPPVRTDQRRAIERAGEWGFDFVELIVEPVVLRSGFDRADGELAAVESSLEAAGLDLLVHLPHRLDVATPFERARAGALADLEEVVGLAAAMGAEKGVVHADSPTTYTGTDPDVLHESIARLDGIAADRGLELCVENVPNDYFAEYGFERLLEETPASITLDTGHAHLSGLGPDEMATLLDEHGDRLSHVHLNDTRGSRDEHLPFAAGALAFDTILDPIRTGWDGTLSFEVDTDELAYFRTSLERLEELL